MAVTAVVVTVAEAVTVAVAAAAAAARAVVVAVSVAAAVTTVTVGVFWIADTVPRLQLLRVVPGTGAAPDRPSESPSSCELSVPNERNRGERCLCWLRYQPN